MASSWQKAWSAAAAFATAVLQQPEDPDSDGLDDQSVVTAAAGINATASDYADWPTPRASAGDSDSSGCSGDGPRRRRQSFPDDADYGDGDVTEGTLEDGGIGVGKTHRQTLRETYRLERRIGSGSTSIVFSARHRVTGRRVAVKMIDMERLDERRAAHLAREVSVMRLLGKDKQQGEHSAIVQLLGVYDGDDGCHIVQELAEGGNLLRHLKSRHSLCSEAEVRVVATRLLDAAKYLDARGVVHRDVKPENCLLAARGDLRTVKLGDFGFAVRPSLLTEPEVACGTAEYIAPEVLLREAFDGRADTWSIGVTTFSLLCGAMPFDGETVDQLFRAILGGAYSFSGRRWRVISPAAKDFVSRMLQADPSRRWTARQLLCHAWIHGATTLSEVAASDGYAPLDTSGPPLPLNDPAGGGKSASSSSDGRSGGGCSGGGVDPPARATGVGDAIEPDSASGKVDCDSGGDAGSGGGSSGLQQQQQPLQHPGHARRPSCLRASAAAVGEGGVSIAHKNVHVHWCSEDVATVVGGGGGCDGGSSGTSEEESKLVQEEGVQEEGERAAAAACSEGIEDAADSGVVEARAGGRDGSARGGVAM